MLLASGSIPGAFPPVLIDVEANGKHFAEMHVDGGVGGQFFVAPPALMASTSDYRMPATQLYIVINSGLQPDFQVVERSTPAILAQAVGMAVKVDLRLMLDRAYHRGEDAAASASTSPPFRRVSTRRAAARSIRNYMKALFEPATTRARAQRRLPPRRRPIRARRQPTRATLPNRRSTTVQNRERPNEKARRVLSPAIAACGLAGGHRGGAVGCGGEASTVRASRAYDGLWSVSIRTKFGPCDAGYRYPARIVGGQVLQADNDFSYQISGAVVASGAIAVTVSKGPAAPPAMAGCAARSGYGRWSAAGNQCYGTWSAMRRASN